MSHELYRRYVVIIEITQITERKTNLYVGIPVLLVCFFLLVFDFNSTTFLALKILEVSCQNV